MISSFDFNAIELTLAIASVAFADWLVSTALGAFELIELNAFEIFLRL